MNNRLTLAMEQNPALAWTASALSALSGGAAWFLENADAVAKLVGLGAAFLGLAAGWYTMRIQRRAWLRGQTRPPAGKK